ncbi:MAG: hypothetical protein R2745_22525 [Vicinamibacterales bacterium]
MRCALGCLVLLLAGSMAVPAGAQPLPDPTPLDLWGAVGVNAVARDGSLLYLGGSFSYVGPATGGLAAIDDASGAVVVQAPDVAGPVEVVLGLPDGGWAIAGILSVRGGAQQRLLRLDASGRVVPWFPDISGVVFAMATDGARLFVGGTFATVDGVARPSVAAFDLATGALSAWTPDIAYTPGAPIVVDLEVAGGVVFAAGLFDRADGQPAGGFAGFAGTSAARLSHAVPPMEVNAMTALGDTLFVIGSDAGSSDSIGARVAIASAVTSAWPVPTGLSWVHRLHATPAAVYARVGSGIEALHPVSGASVGSLAFQSINGEMAVVGGTAYLVADLGPTHCELVKATLATLTLQPGRVACDGFARLGAGPGRAAVAGTRSVGGVYRDGLAAIDLRTGRATAFAPVVTGTVRSLVSIGSVVVAGGDFTFVNGQPQDGVAAVLPDGTLLPWRPIVQGSSNPAPVVAALATDGRRLFLGGTFAMVAGVAAPNLVAFDLASGQLSWTPAPDQPVFALDLHAGTLFAAGAFTSIAGQPRGRGAAFTADSLALIPWDPAADLPIAGIAAGDGIAVTGVFTSLQGQPANGFGVFNRAGQRVARAATSAFQRGIAADGDRLYVAANDRLASTSLGSGVPQAFIATNRSGLAPGAFFRVWALSDLVVTAGNFDTVGDRPRLGLAVFATGAAAPPAPVHASVRGDVLSFAWGPPSGGVPAGYVVEAGRAPGASDIAVVPFTGTAIAGRVPPGTYYLRVRGVTPELRGADSAEAILTVPAPASPPGPPARLTALVEQNGLYLSWSAAPGNAESYVLEAGSHSGAADIGAVDFGALTTRFFAVAPRGLYYLRVRARNAHGLGAASNEVVVSVP